MLPPRLIRRLVLAPLVIILALGFLVLSPFLAVLALVFGLMARARARAGPMRSLRLVGVALVWLARSVDIVGNRLPNVWIKGRQTGESIFTTQIERLARGLDAIGALVIFPEGGNWTPHRWRRGIRRLEHQGRSDLAARARDMPNL